MSTQRGHYSYKTTWLLMALWSIMMVWAFYVANEFFHLNGTLWFALLVTHFSIIFVILAYSDIDWSKV